MQVKVMSLSLILSCLILLLPHFGRAEQAGDFLGRLAVQSGGRVKPFDTFARESLQLIYGKQVMGEKAPSEVVLSWMLIPQEWNKREFIQISNKDLREALKLDATDKGRRYSPEEIMTRVDRLQIIFQDLHERQKQREKLNVYYQAAQRLEGQLGTFQSIVAGAALKLVPPPARPGDDQSSVSWLGLEEWPQEFKDLFQEITRSFAASVRVVSEGASSDEMREVETQRAEALKQLESHVQAFQDKAKMQNPPLYPESRMLVTEIHFNAFHPFGWAWIAYLVSMIFLIVAWRFEYATTVRAPALKIGLIFTALAFLLHSYGFGLRMYLTGRPPVSNMYESVVWVSWGAMLFSMFFARIQRTPIILIAGNMVAVICMIVADMAPSILDASLQPLQPVLRSNVWLTVHVLTITSSYAAFFVAFFLGDIGLLYYLKGENSYKKQIETISSGIYLAVQVGVVLLASGTILGGVWADYSWGRFWGWDPKETWALIALLGYIAVLHGRLAGWLRTFGFVVGAIVSFSLVLMAWYGVNYVLGAGLHSYGFGGGGLPYVTAFVGLHILFVIVTITIRQSRWKASAS